MPLKNGTQLRLMAAVRPYTWYSVPFMALKVQDISQVTELQQPINRSPNCIYPTLSDPSVLKLQSARGFTKWTQPDPRQVNPSSYRLGRVTRIRDSG